MIVRDWPISRTSIVRAEATSLSSPLTYSSFDAVLFFREIPRSAMSKWSVVVHSNGVAKHVFTCATWPKLPVRGSPSSTSQRCGLEPASVTYSPSSPYSSGDGIRAAMNHLPIRSLFAQCASQSVRTASRAAPRAPLAPSRTSQARCFSNSGRRMYQWDDHDIRSAT